MFKIKLVTLCVLLGALGASAQYSTNRPGPIGGSGSVNTNPPGTITPPAGGSVPILNVTTDTNGNVLTPANLQLPHYTLFSTQSVATLTPVPNTNTLYARGAGTVVNGTWTFNSAMGAYTSSPASTAKRLFDDGAGNKVFTNASSTNLYYKTGSFAGQYSVGLATPQAPWATFATNGFTTNYTPVLRSSVDSFDIFGVAFDGGEGFPPTLEQEQGRFVWTTDGTKWVGGTGGKQLTGVTGNMRDPALLDLGTRYALSYTTSVSNTAPYGFSNCTTVPLLVSTNLNHWFFKTNISFAMSGETLVLASNYCWSPVFSTDGSNLWIHASVTTNSATSFEIRWRKTTLAQYPDGWSDAQRITNNLAFFGLTNLIDLTPYYDVPSGRWYACWKNETTKFVELGIFNTDPESLLAPLLTGDHSSWGASCEGNWIVQLPTGKYRIFMNRYQGKEYGGNGQGEQLCFAEADSISGPWSRLTNSITPFNFQSFKPIVVRSAASQVHAIAATLSGMALVGRVNIVPEMTSIQGLYRMGYPYTNNGSITGLDTNAYAGVNFGLGNWGSGVYGKGDGSVRLYARTFDPADTSGMIRQNAKDIMIGQSNRITFAVGEVALPSAITAAEVASFLTNGQVWSGMMSNAYQMAGKSNNVTTWKTLWP